MSVKNIITVTNRGVSPILSIAQGTDSVEFDFKVADYDIPADSSAVAYNIQPTGNIVNQLCSISGNTISITPRAYFFLRGKNYMQFRITCNGKNLFSFLIEVWCSPNITEVEVSEVQDPTVVTQVLSKLGEIDLKIDSVDTRLGNRINNIVANNNPTEGNTELIDIRSGYDGTTYPSAGEAIRKQIGSLSEEIDDIRETNTLLNFNEISISGSGRYVNKSFTFNAIRGSKYFLHVGTIVGGKDRPYAILRLIREDDSTISSVYLDKENTTVSAVATNETAKIKVILNGSGESDLSGETRFFTDVVLTMGSSNKVIKLNANVSLDNNKNIQYLNKNAKKTIVYDNEIVTNVIWISNHETVTGTGQYVNKSFTFNAEKNKKYIFYLGNCKGAKDTPYAFLRTLKADGSTIETVTLSTKNGYIEITTTDETENVKLVLNGSTSSDMGGDTANFYNMLLSIGDKPFCMLSDLVSLENHKDIIELKKNISKNLELYKIFKAVGVIGDSLSVAHMGSSARNVPYSWVKLFEKETGESWRCFGQSGYTTLTWLNGANGYQLASAAGNKCQCYIIGLGVNDCRTMTLGSGTDITADVSINPTTFYGAYSKIIYLVKQINANAKIICLTNPRTDTGGNIDGFNNAIRYISETHFNKTDNVFCLDLTQYTSDYMTGIIANDNKYIGSHYSPIGYVAIFQKMKKILSDFIVENHQYFWNIYNVPYDGGNGTEETRN